MATYRNSFANYFSDKSGNHSPVGSILPVFVDLNYGANDPDYSYPQHLYCDGRELFIRDYPELYSIIKNTYGGAAAVTRTQAAQPGGLRRSYIINNKLFFHFYYDASNNKANLKRPYPYDAVFRFASITNPFGSFPSSGIFDQNTFYSIKEPTEDVSAQAQVNEFAYEITLPDSVDLSTVNTSDYTLDFTTSGGDTHPDIVVQKSYNLRDYPYNIGTFNLPDYRQRKILGYGNVNGAGTATPENAVNNFVGQTGGAWYIPKNTLIDSGEFFVIGDVRTTGYNTIVADVSAYLTGSVKYQVGPMDDFTFPFPPTHSHRILSVEVDETKQAEQGAAEADKYAVNYINSRANISIFEPNGSAGGALGHSHGLIGIPLQNSLTATYGNTNGVGERAGTTGDAEFQYLVSESASVPVTSMTYDAPTGYITINTDGNHGLQIDDIVTVDGASPAEYSGNFTIIADGFGNSNFNVLPRDGEIPASSPATGSSINVKLANGYFVETEVTQNPRMYPVDNNTLVGGKTIQFDIPGNAITIKEETFTTPQAGLVTIPDASAGDVTGTTITMSAPGGGGADSDNDGQSAGFCEVGITVDGVFYTIRAEGGDGGAAGANGGAGGSGGTLTVPAALLSDPRFNITQVPGADGEDGGMTGTGSNDTEGGGVTPTNPSSSLTTGGNGSAQIKNQTNTQPQQVFTTNGSWAIPSVANNEIERTITVEISGGGGGPGNANANSNCVGQWPGWPQATSGKTGALGGYGGRGALLVGTLTQNAGLLNWELGEGGNVGFNQRAGSTVQGTTGNDPATGQPWQNFPGGIGTGSEPGGSSAGVFGASGCISGIGGQGAWGNGATGGSGGGVTGLFLDGVCIAGAGGGGGGGGSGGGYNGGGTTDGCYPGGDAAGPAQALIATPDVLDFANGGNGSSGGCSAGGGGGGGSACGIINVTPGGVGGQAGVGHNGNGGGTGGRRGVSAYRSDYFSGAVSKSNQGALPTSKGYVEIQYSVTTLNYDPVGGAGGSGGQISIEINDINVPVAVTLGSAGNGGGTGSDGGDGQIYVRYAGQEQGTTLPGETTVPTGKYYNCAPDGTPSGAALDGNIWQSSTDDTLKQRAFGLGTGSVAGFGSSGIPFQGSPNRITQYIAFTGAATAAGNDRQLEVGTLALSTVNTIRFTVIRGSGQNGGEAPDEALNLFYQKSGSTNTTLFSEIVLPSNTQTGWQTIDIPIPEGSGIRDDNITLILSQDRPSAANDNASGSVDNYGLAAITLFYDPTTQSTFVATGGATIQGNLDDAGLPINSDVGINQVRRTVTAQDAALTVTDGTFTMSSSTPIVTTADVVAESDIPLITKYHRVKYLIKAF